MKKVIKLVSGFQGDVWVFVDHITAISQPTLKDACFIYLIGKDSPISVNQSAEVVFKLIDEATESYRVT